MAKTKKAYVARDPSALGRVVVLWLHLRIASSAVSLASDLFQLQALSRFPSDTPTSMTQTLPGMETADMVTGLASLLLLVTILASGFLTLKWIYRVTLNSHTLANGLRVSPPASIGWFFVPFANLYKPFQAVSDAWAVSLSPESWRAQDTPPLLRWWWGLWIACSLLDNVSFRLQMRTHDVGMATVSAGLDAVSDALWIPLCLLLIRVVRRLSAQQSGALGASAFS